MYIVTFADGTTFEGGNPADSKWDEIPKKSIKSIEYQLTPFLKYIFSNFESYNHCVERTKSLDGSNLNIITKVIIMGRFKGRVVQVMMDNHGSVYELNGLKYGEEYSNQINLTPEGKFNGWKNGRPLTGWREGVYGQVPKREKIKNPPQNEVG